MATPDAAQGRQRVDAPKFGIGEWWVIRSLVSLLSGDESLQKSRSEATGNNSYASTGAATMIQPD